MTEKVCDYCNEPFRPREAKQRFCGPVCRDEFWKAERRDAMAAYRQHREEEEQQRA